MYVRPPDHDHDFPGGAHKVAPFPEKGEDMAIRYREILRLTALGISQRSIAGSVGCSKTTVQEVQRKAAAMRPLWPLPDEMGDEAIRARLYPPQDRSDAGKAEIDHEWVQREMGRRGVTMTLLWNEYAERAVLAGLKPYMYSSFCHRHQRWADANPELAMHVEWVPGEWTQVDWALPVITGNA